MTVNRTITALATHAEILAILTARFRGERELMKLSRAELAKRSGISVPTIARFELTGVISLPNFIRLTQGLGRVDSLNGLLAQAPYASLADFMARADRSGAGREGGE